MSVIDQLKKLDEQRAKLLDGAKEEALAKAKAAIAELNELGFSYKLTQGEGTTRQAKGTRNTDPSKRHCSLCDLDGHDARAHRTQDPKKKFTQKELQERNLL